jgi:SAM-dependent methyltransferase
MDDNSPARFLSYDVTDITSGFFDKVQRKAEAWGNLVRYKKLDIEKDPEDQGFEIEQYDLIISANVLHATTNMRRTMTNVRRLLKPGGCLLLVELMPKSIGVANIFGIFDGCKCFMGVSLNVSFFHLLQSRWKLILTPLQGGLARKRVESIHLCCPKKDGTAS